MSKKQKKSQGFLDILLKICTLLWLLTQIITKTVETIEKHIK